MGQYLIEGMAVPHEYSRIRAHEDSIQAARRVKEKLDLTWNQFLERGALELDATSSTDD